MTTFEIVQLSVGTGILGSFLVGIFKLGKFSQKIESSTESIQKEVKEIKESMETSFNDVMKRFEKLDVIHRDISDIRERLAFIEATQIYTMPSEPVKPNSRSEAAKIRWERKRQKAALQD